MVFPDKIFAVDPHKLPSTHKGVNSAALEIGNTSTTTVKDLAESPKVALTWHTSKHKVYKLHQRHIVKCTSVVHACQVKLDLPSAATQVFVVVLLLRISSSAN